MTVGDDLLSKSKKENSKEYPMRQPKLTKPRRARSQGSAPKKLLRPMEAWDYMGRPCGVNAWYDAIKPGGAFSEAVVQIAERKLLSRSQLDRIAKGVPAVNT